MNPFFCSLAATAARNGGQKRPGNAPTEGLVLANFVFAESPGFFRLLEAFLDSPAGTCHRDGRFEEHLLSRREDNVVGHLFWTRGRTSNQKPVAPCSFFCAQPVQTFGHIFRRIQSAGGPFSGTPSRFQTAAVGGRSKGSCSLVSWLSSYVFWIFPNETSAWRLVGALLTETHKEWSPEWRYLKEFYQWARWTV